jgi:hypothetical protein
VSDEPQDCFMVFVRTGSGSAWRPEDVEEPVAVCLSYHEAVKIREKFRQTGTSCIIRCIGETGGGD